MILKFNNEKFKILQISDAQDLHIVRKTMIKMIDTACKKLKPDLVIFTGDNILGNHLCDARFGKRKVIHTQFDECERLKTAIDKIASIPEKYGIPFTALFGNHDDMNCLGKNVQVRIFKSYKCFTGIDGNLVGTFNLPVLSTDEKTTAYNIWCMDTSVYNTKTKKCSFGVRADDLVWYINKSNELRAINGGAVINSLMFQHIPMAENRELMTYCRTKEKDSIPCYVPGKEERFVKLNLSKATGVIGEPIVGASLDIGQLNIIKQQGDVRAVVSGHEHNNCYEGEVQGVKVIQTPGASFRCYGTKNRGVRLFTIDEKDTSAVNSKHFTYFDLCGKGPVSKLRYIFDADGEGKKKAALIAFFAVAAAVIGAVIF